MRYRPNALCGCAIVLAALLSSCGRPAHDRAAQALATGCPTPRGGGFRWPAGVVTDLPRPPAARLTSHRLLASGFTEVVLQDPESLTASLSYALTSLTQHGFTVGRGISTPTQVNLPFTRNSHPGAILLRSLGPCATEWRIEV